MASTLDRLGYEAGQLLKIIGALASANGGPAATLRSVGWDLPPGGKDLGLAAIDVSTLVQKLETLEQSLNSGASDAVLAAQFAEVLLEVQRAIANVRGAIAGLSAAGDYLDKTQIKSEILGRLTSLMIASRVGAISPLAFMLLQFFGVIRLSHFDADPTIFQLDHIRVIFDWNALVKLFTDPLGLLKARYGWGTANFDARGFIANLNAIVEVLGEPSRVRTLPRRVEEQLSGKPVPEADTNPVTQVIGNFITGDQFGGVEAGISLFPLRPTTVGGLDAGIALCPFVYGSADISFPLTGELALELESTVALDSGVALQFRPGHDMSIKVGLLTDSIEDHIAGTVLVSLKWTSPDSNKYNLVSFPSGGVIEVASISFTGGVDVLRGSLSPSFGLKLTGGHASLRSDGADSFMSALVPADGASATFDIGVRWSADQGFSFEGSASAAIDLALNLSIGPLRIDSLHVGLLPSGSGLSIETSFTCDAKIGPIGVTLQRFGALIAVSARDGNLGPIDVGLNFKPPSGAGLVVDAAGVSGGGFLARDDAKHEYTGTLQLQFNDLALQAFGLITTQVAGGSGYSLLALIDADFPPVQLGWGFTLDGVGGLLAIHRTASTDALHAALKANTLSTILFPKNAITNAPQVLATLDAIFPTAPGRFLFGPMALIGWGTPTILTAAIAVIVELPEPIRIVLIARLSAKVPSESEALVRINMDALGVLDLSQDSLSLDATLFDSKLLTFTLSGDMALRANWSSTSQREFLLAIGGFHPQFTPPAGFPALKRITIDMPSGPVSKLRLAAYLAITSNTLQFGAALDVFIGVSGFGLLGHLGFDALLQLDPFHFDADISGQVALTAGGDDLMSVGLNATLSGPAPWHIAGDFKVHIVFFDVHISFSHSWGDEAPAQQIAPTPVLPLLTAALADARNWGAALPAGTQSFVSLKDNGAQLVHPLARLEVHESVVPLGLTIERFASAPVTSGNNFVIGDYKINGSTVDHVSIQDDFAPAQFFNLSDDEKLARPSFEQHDAGVRVTGVGLTVSGAPVAKTISYETFYVDQAGGALRTDPVTPPKNFPLGDLHFVLATGASARATIRTAGNQRYTAPGTPVKVVSQSFVIADRTTLAAAAISAQGSTYSDAQEALKAALAASPAQRTNLQIVATHETSAA
jgi:hypothetical protein